jgi:hypothetical protein
VFLEGDLRFPQGFNVVFRWRLSAFLWWERGVCVVVLLGLKFSSFSGFIFAGAKVRRPRNRLSDFEAIFPQTARKPNSVLDDHSSTRRITAAL